MKSFNKPTHTKWLNSPKSSSWVTNANLTANCFGKERKWKSYASAPTNRSQTRKQISFLNASSIDVVWCPSQSPASLYTFLKKVPHFFFIFKWRQSQMVLKRSDETNKQKKKWLSFLFLFPFHKDVFLQWECYGARQIIALQQSDPFSGFGYYDGYHEI